MNFPHRPVITILQALVSLEILLAASDAPSAKKSSPYRDYTSRLDLKRLAPILKELSTNTQLTLEECQAKLNRDFGSFKTFSNFNEAYWATIAYKYFAATGLSNFHYQGVFDFPNMMEELIHTSAENFYPSYPSQTIGILHGLRQFHISRHSLERNEEVLDRIYWTNERFFIGALLQTNVINAYLLEDFPKIRERLYELPIGSLASLYRYEEGGISFEYYKALRIEQLWKLRRSFAKKDQWIFEKTNFEPKH
ncbi:MAG: hypothetical protein JNM63_09645 [Spirochaetia bacterium]|nr:hypothetical protein [Spirochaetia bacterium]